MPAWVRATRKEWLPTAEHRALASRNDALNGVLYRMCKEHPHHRDKNAIRAKVVIIGRAYAAGLERHVHGIPVVTDALHASKSWLDPALDRLRQWDDDPVPSVDRINMLASVHGRLQRAIGQITRNGNNVRSFASKYLHFHAPVVPIFDQFAAAALTDWYRWPPRATTRHDESYRDLVRVASKIPVGADDTYWRHLVRTAFVVQEWESTRHDTPTARAIDTYALSWWETTT